MIVVQFQNNMNKSSENNISTSRILKSKYNQKEKQKTIPLINKSLKKIKLIDLCPQEKLKIGQLIKTLEIRKQQNDKIEQEYDIIQMKYQQCQNKLQQITHLFKQKQHQCQLLSDQIQACKLQLKQKEQIITNLQEEVQQLRNNFQKINIKVQKQEIPVQTEIKIQNHAYTQTKKKKNKFKDFQIQVNLLQARESCFYRPHSKSFQKIMKIVRNYSQSGSQEYQNRVITTERLTKRKYQNRELDKSDSPGIRHFESDSSEKMQSLASKWKQLQEKHVDKQRILHSFNSKQMMQNKNFIQELSDQEQEIDISRKSMAKLQNYDEFSLNRMLKSKNFSANKLISSHKQSIDDSKKKMSPQVNYLKSPYFNDEKDVLGRIKKKAFKEEPDSIDGNINFFESDILELAECVNI